MTEPWESSVNQQIKIERKKTRLTCADYNVAWICALSDAELLAARLMLDEEHASPSFSTQYDRNTYVFGRMGEHRVVLACLPSGRTGNVNANLLTGPMFHTFPNIKITLLVGIGGGVPLNSPQDPREDMYLGDVVVGWPGDGTPAVIQYDYGRWKVDGFEQRGSVDQPDWHLIQALDILISNHHVGQTEFEEHRLRLKKSSKFTNPNPNEDKLYKSSYKHIETPNNECTHCHRNQLVTRPSHATARTDSFLHFHQGTIASGDSIIRDGELRDKLSKDCNGARCFEMEAVGVNLNSRCLVIRGIANYADSHKNDVWKYTAAGNAAVFAKELLLTMNAGALGDVERVEDSDSANVGSYDLVLYNEDNSLSQHVGMDAKGSRDVETSSKLRLQYDEIGTAKNQRTNFQDSIEQLPKSVSGTSKSSRESRPEILSRGSTNYKRQRDQHRRG